MAHSSYFMRLLLMLSACLFGASLQAAQINVAGKHIRADGSDHDFEVQDGDALSPGDRFQIIIGAEKTTYYSILYFAREGGRAAQLFPTTGQAGHIQAGNKQRIPGVDDYFTLDVNGGRELMFIVTADNEMPDLQSILLGAQSIANTPSAINAYLQKHLPQVRKLEITNTGSYFVPSTDQVSSGLVRDIALMYAADPWPDATVFDEAGEERVRDDDNSIPEAVRRRTVEVRSLLKRPKGTSYSSSLRTVRLSSSGVPVAPGPAAQAGEAARQQRPTAALTQPPERLPDGTAAPLLEQQTARHTAPDRSAMAPQAVLPQRPPAGIFAEPRAISVAAPGGPAATNSGHEPAPGKTAQKTQAPHAAVAVAQPEAGPGPSSAPPAEPQQASAETTAELVSRVASAIVSIRTDNNPRVPGFIVDDKGHILTGWHAIRGVSDIDVSFTALSGALSTHKAQVVKQNKALDLALLRLTGAPPDVRPITVLDKELPDPGSKVRVFSQHNGGAWQASSAVITRIASHFTWFSHDATHRGEVLQVDLPPEDGSPGSLVTTTDYRLLGMKSFSSTRSGRIYAVSARMIRDFIASSGEATR